MKRLRYIRWGLLIAGLLCIRLVMAMPGWGEYYARHLYPCFQRTLSFVSSLFPFSIGDCFIYGSIAGLLVMLLLALVRRLPFWLTLRRIVEYLLWTYLWFYAAWGLNYFRAGFYQRAGVRPVAYDEATFRHFLDDYTAAINAAYTPIKVWDRERVDSEIKNGYRKITDRFGLLAPLDRQKGKSMLVSPLMSKVGVSGYLGPFFNEYHLNRDLLPVQFPFTYAHELAHVLGVANEAEANLYAYLVCTASENSEIRFAGYFGILSYVAGNAHGLLDKEAYREWLKQLHPDIIRLLQDEQRHWQSLYSPLIGEIQHRMYNFYLKGNRIASGTKNYGQVIGYIMALEKADSE